MKLKDLRIRLETYGANVGKYEGTIEYEHQDGSSVLLLDAELSEKILSFIGPVITAAALKVSKTLEASLQQSITESHQHVIEEISS